MPPSGLPMYRNSAGSPIKFYFKKKSKVLKHIFENARRGVGFTSTCVFLLNIFLFKMEKQRCDNVLKPCMGALRCFIKKLNFDGRVVCMKLKQKITFKAENYPRKIL